MGKINERCAGIDVGKRFLLRCVPYRCGERRTVFANFALRYYCLLENEAGVAANSPNFASSESCFLWSGLWTPSDRRYDELPHSVSQMLDFPGLRIRNKQEGHWESGRRGVGDSQ